MGGDGLVAIATDAGNVASIADFADLYEAIPADRCRTDGQVMP